MITIPYKQHRYIPKRIQKLQEDVDTILNDILHMFPNKNQIVGVDLNVDLILKSIEPKEVKNK